jgi:hypothetical protein
LLGSASRDLLELSSESLAGRIRYLDLSPFLRQETLREDSLQQYLLRGGFPRSLLADTDEISFEWRCLEMPQELVGPGIANRLEGARVQLATVD